MRRTGQPVEVVVPKRLGSTLVRQRGSVPHPVIEIVRFIDLGTGRGQLVEDVRDLRGGIVGVGRLGAVRQGHRRPAGEGVLRETARLADQILGIR